MSATIIVADLAAAPLFLLDSMALRISEGGWCLQSFLLVESSIKVQTRYVQPGKLSVLVLMLTSQSCFECGVRARHDDWYPLPSPATITGNTHGARAAGTARHGIVPGGRAVHRGSYVTTALETVMFCGL